MQWILELLLYTASLCRGSGQRNSFFTPPHCLVAGGSGIPSAHCPTAQGLWVVELLLYTFSLPGGSRQWNSFRALPHHPGVVGSGSPCVRIVTAQEHGEWIHFSILPWCWE